MNKQDAEQIQNLIRNFAESREFVPFLHNLESHPVFGPIIQNLSDADKSEVNKLIDEVVVEKIESLKTKGGQLFRRFFENNEQLFREFRQLNEDEKSVNTAEFQELGKHIEHEMFKLEGILTQAMLKRAQGLAKTVESFYTIVYSFFPLYGQIE